MKQNIIKNYKVEKTTYNVSAIFTNTLMLSLLLQSLSGDMSNLAFIPALKDINGYLTEQAINSNKIYNELKNQTFSNYQAINNKEIKNNMVNILNKADEGTKINELGALTYVTIPQIKGLTLMFIGLSTVHKTVDIIVEYNKEEKAVEEYFDKLPEHIQHQILNDTEISKLESNIELIKYLR